MTQKSSATTYVLLIVTAAAAVLLFYAVIDPARHQWIPKCPLHMLTGWECPVCGTQRALHAMLHGEVRQAFQHNAFFVCSLPYLALLLIAECLKPSGRGTRFIHIIQKPLYLQAFFVLALLWGIIRNVFNL
ncbi:MAG: DUF2752 domain-containing protein [Bacteroidales bacterium]|nr:DUF2752 domain-containing protein [Bacteroidales bacterium]